jgi:hypothetical protein
VGTHIFGSLLAFGQGRELRRVEADARVCVDDRQAIRSRKRVNHGFRGFDELVVTFVSFMDQISHILYLALSTSLLPLLLFS